MKSADHDTLAARIPALGSVRRAKAAVTTAEIRRTFQRPFCQCARAVGVAIGLELGLNLLGCRVRRAAVRIAP